MKLLILLINAALAAGTGNLVLSGSVPALTSITLTPNGTNNTSLNILAGETNKNVAAAQEVSNNPTGYKILLSSTNGGKLERTPSDFTAYQVSYDGGAYVTPNVTATQVKNVGSLAANTTYNSTILVNVTAKPAALAGTYSDTLTITIQANP